MTKNMISFQIISLASDQVCNDDLYTLKARATVYAIVVFICFHTCLVIANNLCLLSLCSAHLY